MRDIELKLDAEPKDNYGKAFKLLLEAEKAYQVLTDQEKQKLACEYARYKGAHELYQILRYKG